MADTRAAFQRFLACEQFRDTVALFEEVVEAAPGLDAEEVAPALLVGRASRTAQASAALSAVQTALTSAVRKSASAAAAAASPDVAPLDRATKQLVAQATLTRLDDAEVSASVQAAVRDAVVAGAAASTRPARTDTGTGPATATGRDPQEWDEGEEGDAALPTENVFLSGRVLKPHRPPPRYAPRSHPPHIIYEQLRQHLGPCHPKARSLYAKLEAHRTAAPAEAALTGLRVLIVGAGIAGLRAALEAALLGAEEVTVLEKRDAFTRNNVLHLWPTVMTELRLLGTKDLWGPFGIGSVDHISIWRLQTILLKLVLLVGVRGTWVATLVPSPYSLGSAGWDGVSVVREGERDRVTGHCSHHPAAVAAAAVPRPPRRGRRRLSGGPSVPV